MRCCYDRFKIRGYKSPIGEWTTCVVVTTNILATHTIIHNWRMDNVRCCYDFTIFILSPQQLLENGQRALLLRLLHKSHLVVFRIGEWTTCVVVTTRGGISLTRHRLENGQRALLLRLSFLRSKKHYSIGEWTTCVVVTTKYLADPKKYLIGEWTTCVVVTTNPLHQIIIFKSLENGQRALLLRLLLFHYLLQHTLENGQRALLLRQNGTS